MVQKMVALIKGKKIRMRVKFCEFSRCGLLRTVSLSSALLLAACATQAPPEGYSPDPEADPKAVISPGKNTSPAVLDLLERARVASRAGENQKAEAYLERAIRIEPRNPALWHYMAKVHLYGGRLQKAQGLAAKSNSLAGKNVRLRSDNWRIIAHAKQGLGDKNGARAAQDKANALAASMGGQ